MLSTGDTKKARQFLLSRSSQDKLEIISRKGTRLELREFRKGFLWDFSWYLEATDMRQK